MLDTAKREAQSQWNQDPCGSNSAQGQEEGSAEFFGAARQYRYERYAPWMHEAIPFREFRGKKVLEIGPGLGTDHVEFASNGAQTYAIDLARRHLELTRRNLALHGHPDRGSLADAENLPFGSESFDAVYTFGVLHHTPHTQRAINEIQRVLKPGGTAIVVLYHRDSPFYWINMMLIRGVLALGLVRKGYRRLLSEVEFRSPGSAAVPLVKVHSRSQSRRMFGRFSRVEVNLHHLDFNHFLPGFYRIFRGATPTRARHAVERFARYAGWYIVIRGEK